MRQITLINASIILKKEEYEVFNISKQKLGITKYSIIVTNSNDSVTLRLMTEHDLAML